MSKSSKILLIFTILAVIISLGIIGLSFSESSNSNSDMNAPMSNQSPF